MSWKWEALQQVCTVSNQRPRISMHLLIWSIWSLCFDMQAEITCNKHRIRRGLCRNFWTQTFASRCTSRYQCACSTSEGMERSFPARKLTVSSEIWEVNASGTDENTENPCFRLQMLRMASSSSTGLLFRVWWMTPSRDPLSKWLIQVGSYE